MRLIVALLSLVATALAGACTPAPDASKVGTGPIVGATCPGGANFITSKVQVLPIRQKTFHDNFGGYGTQYVAPSGSPATGTPEASQLQQAFDLAPPWFRSALCTDVDIIFIDPTDYGPGPGHPLSDPELGWAFWEATTPRQGSGTHTFIGISKASFYSDDSADLRSFERTVFTSLLPKQSSYPSFMPRFASGVQDGRSLALLAILAHEMGHLFWHVTCDNRMNQTNQRGCFKEFHALGWSSVGTAWNGANGRGIHFFGTELPGATHRAGTSPQEVLRDVPPYDKVRQALQSGVWASVFGSVAPDEDTAETYKLLVLVGANQFSDIDINFNDGASNNWNANSSLQNGALCQKANFIRSKLGQSSVACP